LPSAIPSGWRYFSDPAGAWVGIMPDLKASKKPV
jgi:hypothetical protein